MKRRSYVKVRYTFAGYLMNALLIYFLVIFSAGLFVQTFVKDAYGDSIPLKVLFAFILVVPALYLWRRNQMKKRSKAIIKMAAANGWEYGPEAVLGGVPAVNMNGLALDLLDKRNDTTHFNELHTLQWSYCDYSYGIYRKTKHGEYKAAEVYYAVMGTLLPRALPNVLFDSRKSRRRQFRLLITADQKHSLEGDFDKHFVTYFPPTYTVDSMSFITPEVMWAMREASEYDIEIVGDRLFLYGPMFDPEQQIPEMSAKLLAIKSKLLNNILTYRDERLPFDVGRQKVALLGMSLKRSRWPLIISTTITVMWIIIYLVIKFLPK